MIKKLILAVFVVSLVTQAKLSQGENLTFRNSEWGMTKDQVTASESSLDPVSVNGQSITYKTQILGKNVELLYLFSQNRLIGTAYKLDDNYLNSNHFLNTYKRFKTALTRKYGQPQNEDTTWTDNTFKNVSLKRGLALSLGHTEYLSKWETPQTMIKLSLKEENYHVLCLIEYWSKEYTYMSEETTKEDILDPF